eukprot:c30337_g1_i1 orf=142-462(+)
MFPSSMVHERHVLSYEVDIPRLFLFVLVSVALAIGDVCMVFFLICCKNDSVMLFVCFRGKILVSLLNLLSTFMCRTIQEKLNLFSQQFGKLMELVVGHIHMVQWPL